MAVLLSILPPFRRSFTPDAAPCCREHISISDTEAIKVTQFKQYPLEELLNSGVWLSNVRSEYYMNISDADRIKLDSLIETEKAEMERTELQQNAQTELNNIERELFKLRTIPVFDDIEWRTAPGYIQSGASIPPAALALWKEVFHPKIRKAIERLNVEYGISEDSNYGKSNRYTPASYPPNYDYVAEVKIKRALLDTIKNGRSFYGRLVEFDKCAKEVSNSTWGVYRLTTKGSFSNGFPKGLFDSYASVFQSLTTQLETAGDISQLLELVKRFRTLNNAMYKLSAKETDSLGKQLKNEPSVQRKEELISSFAK